MATFTKYVVLLVALFVGFANSQITPEESVVKPAAEKQYFWETESRSGRLTVAIYPREGSIPLNTFHHWIISLKDQAGNPVVAARLKLVGGMPGHGHGMPSAPKVTDNLENGEYLVEGVKFNMMGSWELRVLVKTAGQTDVATFDIELEY